MLHTAASKKRRLLYALGAAVLLFPLLGMQCRTLEQSQAMGLASIMDPTGSLDLVEGGNGQVRVAGWATQWDVFVGPDAERRDQGPVQIVVMVNGQWAQGAVPADDPRPDVDAFFVAQGAWNYRQDNMGYGFDFTKPAPAGETSVCVVALNQNLDISPAGAHILLGCRTVTVT